MRQYKFRGKRVDNGQWVYGNVVIGYDATHIVYKGFDDDYKYNFVNLFIPVLPETVGQFTGMQDMEDTEIYEGDIVDINMNKIPVTYENGCFYTIRGTSRYRLGGWAMEAVNVVGNIFDNSEIINA